MGIRRGDDGNSTTGPDWDDVREYLDYIEDISHRGVQLLIKPEKNYSNPRGFRIELWLDGIPVPLASQGIGRRYAGGSKTMAGAAYVACLKGDEALALAAAVAVNVSSHRNRRKSKKA